MQGFAQVGAGGHWLGIRLQFHPIQQIAQGLQLFLRERDAFTHLLFLRRPVAQVVFGVAVIPTDEIQFLGPAARGCEQYAGFCTISYLISAIIAP